MVTDQNVLRRCDRILNTTIDKTLGEDSMKPPIYAQLVLMDRYPNIRYADLMNPHMYQAEKREAGGIVAEALADYRGLGKTPPPTFEKLADVVASATRAVQNLDVRREYLYAMGQPENLSAGDMCRLMAI